MFGWICIRFHSVWHSGELNSIPVVLAVVNAVRVHASRFLLIFVIIILVWLSLDLGGTEAASEHANHIQL